MVFMTVSVTWTSCAFCLELLPSYIYLSRTFLVLLYLKFFLLCTASVTLFCNCNDT